MDLIAAGFWGAFFGAAALALAGALLAFTHAARRVALTGSSSVVLSSAYVLLFLGWVPHIGGDVLQRMQSLTAIASAAVLALLLFMLLNTFRKPESVHRARRIVLTLALLAGAAAWFTPARDALEIGIGAAFIVAVASIAASVSSARHGEQTGRLALAAQLFLLLAMAGLDRYALHPERSTWPLHAASAVSGIAFLACISMAMWSRYSYLIEVGAVMTHGPGFDPITRMPAYEPGQRPASEVFPAFDGRPSAIIVISIPNMHMLEELHGRAAYNHALFVCASRLRRLALPGVEYALLPDGFVLLFRHPPEVQRLVEHVRMLVRRLSRPVLLGTTRDIAALEASGRIWEAQPGLGLMLEPGKEQLEVAIAGTRAMSRTAWSYASRIAWYDEAAQEIAQLPAGD